MALFSTNGTTSRTMSFLQKMQSFDFAADVDGLAQRGVAALQANTPMDSGATAAAWGYEIERTNASITITWTNSNTINGVNVAILLQYGHGTGTGGYVAGREYINSSLQPIFDEIANDVWKKVTSA